MYIIFIENVDVSSYGDYSKWNKLFAQLIVLVLLALMITLEKITVFIWSELDTPIFSIIQRILRIEMIRSHKKINEDPNNDSLEDSTLSSQDQSSFLTDTIILSSNLESDDSQTVPYDLSQSSSNFNNNSLPIDYSHSQEKSTSSNSDIYSSALSHNEIGPKYLMNICGYSAETFSDTSNETISLQSLNTELDVKSEGNEEKNNLKRKREELIENIQTHAKEIRKLDLEKEKLAIDRKNLTEEKVFINSKAILLAKEMTKIQANINLIQKSHDDVSEFCMKSDKILRQNKIKLKDIKARLDKVERENCKNNLGYTFTYDDNHNLASTSIEKQEIISGQYLPNIMTTHGSGNPSKNICRNKTEIQESQGKVADTNHKDVIYYWSVGEEARLKVYMDTNDLWESFKTNGIEIVENMRRENIVAPHRSFRAIRTRLYRIRNNFQGHMLRKSGTETKMI